MWPSLAASPLLSLVGWGCCTVTVNAATGHSPEDCAFECCRSFRVILRRVVRPWRTLQRDKALALACLSSSHHVAAGTLPAAWEDYIKTDHLQPADLRFLQPVPTRDSQKRAHQPRLHGALDAPLGP